MRRSRVLEKLRRDEWIIIPQVGQIPSFKIVEMLGMIGFDAVWIDMEHKDFGYDTLAQMTLACRATGMDPVVRIVKDGYTSVIRPLEAGAAGLIIPHCMSPEEAAKIVRWAKFAPEGLRGVDGAGVDGNYIMMDLPQYVKDANRETFLVVQIEDREAVECVEEIAAVKGIDVLFVGPADLSQSYGVFPHFDHPLILTAIDKVAEAATRHGKWWGIPVGSVDHAREMIGKGARFLAHGAEVIVLTEGFRAIKDRFDALRKDLAKGGES